MMRPTLFPISLLPALLLASCSQAAPEEYVSSNASPIIGGVLDNGTGAHESVVMLVMGNTGACTGSLIAPNLVLTARHCVSKVISDGIGCDIYGASSNGDHVSTDLTASTIKVYTGAQPNMGSPVAAGSKIFHPTGAVLCDQDIALLLLNKSITGAKPMAIRLAFGPQKGEMTMPVGYGLTNPNNQYSSGVRYRRANVPVITSGMDWNQLTGANEFALGQSTCQGDSGGPIIAMSSGAIIGVTSRGGDCIKSNQIFSRLDMHADLINQALTEAKAAAVDEGVAAPDKVKPLAAGKGPCDTGSDCADYLCKGTGATSYCTRLCNSGTCPSTMFCTPGTVVISGQTASGENICQPKPADTVCDTCRYQSCKVSMEKCLMNATCAKLSACRDKCTTDSCRTTCDSQNTAGASLYAKVTSCMCTSVCGTQCANACGEIKEDAGVPVDSGVENDAGEVDSGEVDTGDPGETPDPAATDSATGSSGGCAVSERRADSRFVFAFTALGALSLLGRKLRRRSV